MNIGVQIDFEIGQLIRQCKTLSLATLDLEGNPEVSMVPFVYDAETHCFYTVVRAPSSYMAHLSARKPSGILIMDTEQEVSELLARKRLSYACNVHEIFRGTKSCFDLQQKMTKKFGAVIDRLFDLADYRAFCLNPYSGRYIARCGKVYTLSGEQITFIGSDFRTGL